MDRAGRPDGPAHVAAGGRRRPPRGRCGVDRGRCGAAPPDARSASRPRRSPADPASRCARRSVHLRVARCAQQDGDLATAATSFGRAAAQVAAEHGLLKHGRSTPEFGRGLLAMTECELAARRCLDRPRELALDGGHVLADVAPHRPDRRRPRLAGRRARPRPSHWPRRRRAHRRRCGSAPCSAVMQMSPGRHPRGAGLTMAGAQRHAGGSALAQPDRVPGRAATHASTVRAFRPHVWRATSPTRRRADAPRHCRPLLGHPGRLAAVVLPGPVGCSFAAVHGDDEPARASGLAVGAKQGGGRTGPRWLYRGAVEAGRSGDGGAGR